MGQVAVSAFYSDRDCPKKNMKRQCNWHGLTPFWVHVTNRLPLWQRPYPLRGNSHFIRYVDFCQSEEQTVYLQSPH